MKKLDINDIIATDKYNLLKEDKESPLSYLAKKYLAKLKTGIFTIKQYKRKYNL